MLIFTIVFLVLALALQAFDALSTITVINDGGRERNKVIAWMMSRIGVTAALVIIKLFEACVIVGIAFFTGLTDEYRILFLAFVVLLYGLVVVNNINQE